MPWFSRLASSSCTGWAPFIQGKSRMSRGTSVLPFPSPFLLRSHVRALLIFFKKLSYFICYSLMPIKYFIINLRKTEWAKYLQMDELLKAGDVQIFCITIKMRTVKCNVIFYEAILSHLTIYKIPVFFTLCKHVLLSVFQ